MATTDLPDGGGPTGPAAATCGACGVVRPTGGRFCVACGEPGPPTPEVPVADGGPPRGAPRCDGCDRPLDHTWACCPRCGRTLGPAPAARTSGWHPDPFRERGLRWWDGSAWTASVWDGAAQWDPLTFEDPPAPGIPGIGVAAAGAAVGLAIGFPVAFVLHETGEPGGRAVLLLAGALALWSGLVGALWYVARRRGTGSIPRDFGLAFRWIDVPLGVAGWIAGRILGGMLAAPIVVLWPDLEPTSEDLYGDATRSTAEWVVLVVVVVIGAPLVEELFFRGLLQPRLVARFGTVTGVAVGAVIFGLAHLTGWVGEFTIVVVAATIGAGAVFGVLRLLTGRLGAPVIAHAVFNAQAVLVMVATT